MDQPRRGHPENRDIVVIGTSAGGLSALKHAAISSGPARQPLRGAHRRERKPSP